MKIKVTEERECCHPNDLRTYRPDVTPKADHPLKFCCHCGRRWEWTRRAGEMDHGWEPVEEVLEMTGAKRRLLEESPGL